MERKDIWGLVLFGLATALLLAGVFKFASVSPLGSAGVSNLLSGFGLWLVVVSAVYLKRPWQKNGVGGVGLCLVIASFAINLSV